MKLTGNLNKAKGKTTSEYNRPWFYFITGFGSIFIWDGILTLLHETRHEDLSRE